MMQSLSDIANDFFFQFFRTVAQVIIAVLRIQGSAENWKKMVEKVSSKSTTPVSE